MSLPGPPFSAVFPLWGGPDKYFAAILEYAAVVSIHVYIYIYIQYTHLHIYIYIWYPPPSRSPRLGQSRVLLHPSWLPGSGSWVGVGYFKCKPLTLRKHWKKLAPPTFSVSEAQKKLVGPTFSKISTIFLETSWKSRNWWKKLAPPTFSEPEVREKLVGPAFSKIFTIFLEASWESRNW